MLIAPKIPEGAASRPGVTTSASAEEEALQDREHFLPGERLDPLRRAVVLEHASIVLERAVRGLERVAELVPLEEIVVATRLAAGPMLRIDRATDSPERAFLAL